MVGWHHRLDRHEFEQALGVSKVQRSLACCSLGSQRVGYDCVTELTVLRLVQYTVVLKSPGEISYSRCQNKSE